MVCRRSRQAQLTHSARTACGAPGCSLTRDKRGTIYPGTHLRPFGRQSRSINPQFTPPDHNFVHGDLVGIPWAPQSEMVVTGGGRGVEQGGDGLQKSWLDPETLEPELIPRRLDRTSSGVQGSFPKVDRGNLVDV